jgi:hypothetical protein
MSQSRNGFIITIVIGVCITATKAQTPAYPPDVQSVLNKAGENKGELESVLAHYRASDDALKLQAAYFLVANMEGHSYVTFALYDSLKEELPFEVLDYASFDTLEAAFDSLEKSHPGLDFDKKETIEDVTAIKSGFLINQIDYAFRAWREKPWARAFSFPDFCEYILPYRGSNEPLENWREYFWNKYSSIQAQMADSTDPIEAVRTINKDVMTYFTFDPRFYYHPTDEGLAEMLATHLGRCEDMTNISIYAMRANGLAVTSDYTPYWANSGNNHAWNAIVTADGRVLPFMGAEANPGEYHLWNKLAKVYRKTYSKQPGNLIFQERKQEKVPAWLAGKSYKDVTSDYVKTSDIAVPLAGSLPDSIDVAYICVFNDGEWKPIQWGWIKNGEVAFAGMGTDIAYLPAFYVNEKIVPAGPPFILNDGGNIEVLEKEDPEVTSLSLVSTMAREQQASTDGVARTFLELGREYELFYWLNEWKSLGKKVADEKPLLYDRVPEGFLYWLVATGSNKDERIFSINNGKQVWW